MLNKETKILGIAFGILLIIMSSSEQVFADHMTASVSAPQGTDVPGCEETNKCFIPYEVTVDVGGVVTWSNDDSAAHTVTSGTGGDGPNGIFDSVMLMAGTTFSHTFEAPGTFPYFCMLHPWMVGIVSVTGTGGEKEPEYNPPPPTPTEKNEPDLALHEG